LSLDRQDVLALLAAVGVHANHLYAYIHGWELARNAAAVIGVLLAFSTAVAKVFGRAKPAWLEWCDRRSLRKRVGAELYTV